MSFTPYRAGEVPRALQNVRDLGGLPVSGGGRVREGMVWRSDAPRAGDSVPPLIGWPPRTVIDLRAPFERELPHPLDSPVTTVIALPLMNSASLTQLGKGDGAAPELSTLYRGMVRTQGPTLAQIVGLMADAPAPVLVHCSAGKDRTGVAIAVLLSALGVARDAVLDDYAATDPNMPGVILRLLAGPEGDAAVDIAGLLGDHPHLFRAHVPVMEAMLAELAELAELAGPRGPERWLLDQGLSPETLDRLRRRLVAPDA